jgi:hypothetical protein
LPESIEHQQFGKTAFRERKKAYCLLGRDKENPYLQFWVGRDAQGGFTDRRFSIPHYVGHNGWLNLNLNLNLSDRQDCTEIESMVKTSYRHFALKRMLKALDQ